MNEIRVANASDAERISMVILKTSIDCCFSQEEPCPDWYRESIAPHQIRELIDSTDYEWLVATQREDIVGVLAVAQKKHIKYYFVLHEVQAMGIGRKLWNEAVRRSILVIEVSVRSSINAVPVYEKLGFVKTGKASTFNGMVYQPMAAKYG